CPPRMERRLCSCLQNVIASRNSISAGAFDAEAVGRHESPQHLRGREDRLPMRVQRGVRGHQAGGSPPSASSTGEGEEPEAEEARTSPTGADDDSKSAVASAPRY